MLSLYSPTPHFLACVCVCHFNICEVNELHIVCIYW